MKLDIRKIRQWNKKFKKSILKDFQCLEKIRNTHKKKNNLDSSQGKILKAKAWKNF